MPSFALDRRLVKVTVAGIVAALTLAACGSNNPSTTNTTSPDNNNSTSTSAPNTGSLTAQLSTLEKGLPAGHVALTEDGSSLLYPLYEAWAAGFAQQWPNLTSTSGADGSGTGISDAEHGTTILGGSDAYLPPTTFTDYPTIENIPTSIAAAMVNYNLPHMSSVHLKLDATVLADMYSGKITMWNDPLITRLNPGVTLPAIKVVPVHRSDSSGTSFLFTSYLAAADASSFAASQGPSTSPTWPSVPGALADKGTSGVVAACGQTPGCVAYIGISYLSDTTKAHLGEAMLENQSGAYELPNAATIDAEASGYTNVPANGAISLIYGSSPTGYPVVNFEYLVVKTNQSSATVAAGLKAYLAWIVDPVSGNSATYLGPVGFQPLPSGALAVAVSLINKIS